MFLEQAPELEQGRPRSFDAKSYVALRTQRVTHSKGDVNVKAIEVTWSPLTQWIKNDRLSDDFTSPGIVSCRPDQVAPVITKGRQAQRSFTAYYMPHNAWPTATRAAPTRLTVPSDAERPPGSWFPLASLVRRRTDRTIANH